MTTSTIPLPEIMAADISLRATGLTLPNGQCFTLETGDARHGHRRLFDLQRMFRHYLRSWPCRLLVIEAPAVTNHGRQGSMAATVGIFRAQGAILTVAGEYRLPVAEVELHTLKTFACGKGNADKKEMMAAANRHRDRHRAHIGANTGPLDDDNQADAWWLREMGLWHLGVRGRLDPSYDDFLHADAVREKAVHGPWNKTPGARWPGQ